MQTENSSPRLIEVVLPLPLEATFTYSVPPELSPSELSVGCRVVVPFGRKKFYTGIVVGFPHNVPEGIETKEIAMVLDKEPVLRHPQLKLWEWIAQYYLCTMGEVYKAALPSGLKLESETFVELNPDFDFSADMPSDDRAIAVVALLQHEKKALKIDEIVQKLAQKGVTALISRMIGEGSLIISEKLVERYRAQKVAYIRFSDNSPEGQAKAFEAAKGAPKQETLLLALTQMMREQTPAEKLADGEPQEITRKALLERSGCSPAILSALVNKGVLENYSREVNRFQFQGRVNPQLPQLSEPQTEALDKIHKSWMNKDVTLLHGVTSSGKTEIYIHLIDYVLRQGRQALYLVPEIALTTQLTRRLQRVFGQQVVIYHSKFSDNERVDIWKRLLHSAEPCVVIGARSSVFLPFVSLGLVIVDEEHESSYKQYDPAPRYNARDTGMVLARMHGAKVLLGSATPSIETYYKAKEGKYGLVTLNNRFGDLQLPPIRLVDMKQARLQKALRGAFATDTVRYARQALDRGAQVIFFQNRRGYAPLVRCRACSWVPKCQQCDVSLTYHRNLHQLQCHYCGAVYPVPPVCPQCHEPSIDNLGYGTERVSDDVDALFADIPALRMDLDTTRAKDAYSQIIDDFSQRKARILVGTQMVTKGLDFAGVEMVGVLNADSVIHYPDFRSAERAFNMLEQVAGRAGRRDDAQSVVVVQTHEPQHPILQYVLRHDYLGFYQHEVAERQRFMYPPFCRVIYIYLKHKDARILTDLAQAYATQLRALLGQRVFGPEEPAVNRIQGLYIRKIMLKLELTASPSKVKELLRATYIQMHADPRMRGLMVYYDVDPY